MKTNPLTTTEEAANVGTDVSIGPGETIPEAEGKRRPGTFGNEPERAPSPDGTPRTKPDNPGDDPGVAPPLQQPDVLGSELPASPVDDR